MDYRQLAYQTAQKYGIDPDLFVRQIQAESAFRPNAVSSAGAIGLGQLMPATAKELGVDPTDPVQNLEGAARYMKQQLDRFGDPALALAAYNAGPSRVAKANGVPNITETQNYVAKILGGKGGAAMAQEPQKQPQGLLGGLLGGQGIGGALGLSDDFRDRLAMGIMAGSDPRQFAPLIQQRAASMKERRAEAKEQRQRNKSIEFLQSRADAGDATAKEILGAVSTGALPIGTGVSTYLTQTLTAPKDERTALMKEYDLSKTDPEFAKLLGLKNAPEAPAGLKALDTEFAKSLGEGGGAQNVAAAMQDLASVQTVLNKLEAGEELTGPFIGSLPESVRAFIAPEGLQAQQLVESVVQKNLRAILGGQFAQKEGEQLVRRAYNPSLTPAQNAARLRALIPTLQAAAENKLAMTEYFLDPNNNYSLKGFSGLVGVPSLSVFMNALDEGESDLSSSEKGAQTAPAAASNVTHIFNPQTGKVEPVK